MLDREEMSRREHLLIIQYQDTLASLCPWIFWMCLGRPSSWNDSANSVCCTKRDLSSAVSESSSIEELNSFGMVTISSVVVVARLVPVLRRSLSAVSGGCGSLIA